jgi:hypothetical protein
VVADSAAQDAAGLLSTLATSDSGAMCINAMRANVWHQRPAMHMASRPPAHSNPASADEVKTRNRERLNPTLPPLKIGVQ